MLRLLIVEGNTADMRGRHCEFGGEAAHALYAQALARLGFDFRHDVIFAADADADLPHGPLQAYDGVVWTGSALNIYTGGAAVARQIELARACFRARVPQFGSCWGLQVAVAAAGGSVILNPRGREIGIARAIALTPAGRDHPMFAGKPAVFDALAVHKDTIAALPPGAQLLASNENSLVQAAAFTSREGSFWGVQYHPEYSFGEVAACMRRYARALVEEGLFAGTDEVTRAAQEFGAFDSGGTPLARWRHGVTPALADPLARMSEIRNWLTHAVLPARQGRV